MRIGSAKVNFDFAPGIPLAGYVTAKERIAKHILDAPSIRAFAIENKTSAAVICSCDLLIMTYELYTLIKEKIRSTVPENAVLFLHCTHTHSSAGGYMDHKVGRWFMGKYRPALFEQIADTIATAAKKAWIDREEGKAAIGKSVVYGMNHSRRDPDAEVDNRLTVIRFDNAKGPKAALVRFSAHPVIASEKDFFALSADFPGAVCSMLEAKIPSAAFLQGSLGGVGPVWPDHINDAKRHIAFMAEPIAEKALSLFDSLTPDPDLHFASGYQLLNQPPAGADPFPQTWKIRKTLYKPLVKIWDQMFANEYANREIPIPAMVIGNRAIIGYPADLGDGLSQTINAEIKAMGLSGCDCLSQTNDYIGYVHTRQDMDNQTLGDMGLYENFMGFHGRQCGDRFLEVSKSLVKNLSDS